MLRSSLGIHRIPRPEYIAIDENVLGVPLGKGAVALIDAEDEYKVCNYLWRLSPQGYVHATVSEKIGNKRRTVRLLMHRLILEGKILDHINGNKLDNRKCNLRAVTASQNNWNSGKYQKATSKYKGVSWHKRAKAWQCHICVNRKVRYVGTFKSEVDAAKAYDEIAFSLRGEYARLNFGRDFHGIDCLSD